MSPKKNNIRLTTISTLPYTNNEVWFEGECLYIDSQHINEILVK